MVQLNEYPHPIGITYLHSTEYADVAEDYYVVKQSERPLWERRVIQGFCNRLARFEESLTQQFMMGDDECQESYTFGQRLGHGFSDDICWIQS